MVTVMNSRAVDLVAGSRERWPLAGDQLYVDLDLSTENLPTGTRLTIGDAELEVTGAPAHGVRAVQGAVRRRGAAPHRHARGPACVCAASTPVWSAAAPSARATPWS